MITPDYSAAVGTEVVNRNVKLSPIANCNAPMFNSLKWKMITQDQDPKLDTQVKLPNKNNGTSTCYSSHKSKHKQLG